MNPSSHTLLIVSRQGSHVAICEILICSVRSFVRSVGRSVGRSVFQFRSFVSSATHSFVREGLYVRALPQDMSQLPSAAIDAGFHTQELCIIERGVLAM